MSRSCVSSTAGPGFEIAIVSTFPSSLWMVCRQSALIRPSRLTVKTNIRKKLHIATNAGVEEIQLWVASDYIDQNPGSLDEINVSLLETNDVG